MTRGTITMQADPTPYTDINELLERLLSGVQAVLGKNLVGPSPTTFIDPISHEEFMQAVQEQAKRWGEWIHHIPKRRPSQAYAILTLCRALYSLKQGEQVSKKQAALWAKKEFPEWSVCVQNALLWREAWRDENVDHDATFQETLRFVRFAVSQCEIPLSKTQVFHRSPDE